MTALKIDTLLLLLIILVILFLSILDHMIVGVISTAGCGCGCGGCRRNRQGLHETGWMIGTPATTSTATSTTAAQHQHHQQEEHHPPTTQDEDHHGTAITHDTPLLTTY